MRIRADELGTRHSKHVKYTTVILYFDGIYDTCQNTSWKHNIRHKLDFFLCHFELFETYPGPAGPPTAEHE
jgi:hypothetical protein